MMKLGVQLAIGPMTLRILRVSVFRSKPDLKEYCVWLMMVQGSCFMAVLEQRWSTKPPKRGGRLKRK